MDLDIISYEELLAADNTPVLRQLEKALLNKGIIGVRGIPGFGQTTQAYVDAVRAFSALPETVKQQYAPDRETGDIDGYEIGAEKFQDQDGNWHIDDKKASYYAVVPDQASNKWPREVDLKTPYLALGELIFQSVKYYLLRLA